ncbi:MAG TPA: hypothetical protein VN776_01340 [Terracidiphilus sp.]|nr:hypothetical protein [Terracidiphilus sp.]
MKHHNLTPRQYMILGLVALCAPLGDTCLSRGMTNLPPISLAHPVTLIAAVFTPWIALGIALLIGFFASYLTALSWADLTFVLPATAFGNVIVALFARFWLQESISLERWAGILLITLGVGFVAQGPSLTERPAENLIATSEALLLDPLANINDSAVPAAVGTAVEQEVQSR